MDAEFVKRLREQRLEREKAFERARDLARRDSPERRQELARGLERLGVEPDHIAIRMLADLSTPRRTPEQIRAERDERTRARDRAAREAREARGRDGLGRERD